MSTSNPFSITQSTGGASAWYRLPAIDTDPIVFTGTLTTGDSIVIELSNDNALDAGLSADRLTSSATTTQISSSPSFTANSFSNSAIGTWKWFRMNKTGTAGAATIQAR